MANLKQMKCPSCGAGLSLNSPYEIAIECPYCHSQVVNENAYQTEDHSVQPTILPFHWSEDDIMENFVNHIAGIKDSSTDLFAKISISAISKYYVPLYIFEGSFRAPWTAKVPRNQKNVGVRNGKLEETYQTVYDFVNGEAVGNFSFKSIPEDEAMKIGIDLNFLQGVEIHPANCLPLSSVKIEDHDVKFIPPAGNADFVWHQNAEQMALGEAYAVAQSQCPQPTDFHFFHKSEIVSCSASCEMRKATLIFIPIWRVDYEYNDNSYCYISYVEQERKWTCTYPHAEAIQAEATEEQQALLDGYKDAMSSHNNFLGCSLILLIVLEVFTLFGITDFFEELRDVNFGWYFPLFAVIICIINGVVDSKKKSEYGVDEIKADIESRTNIARKEASEYKKRTSVNFLESKA